MKKILGKLKMRSKLLLFYFITGFIPLVFVSIWLLMTFWVTIEEDAFAKNSLYLDLSVDQLDKYFLEHQEEANVLSGSPVVYEAILNLENNQVMTLVDNYIYLATKEYGYSGIFITDKAGRVIATTEEAVGTDMSSEIYVQKSIDENRQNWSEAFSVEEGKEVVMVLSTPIHQNGIGNNVIGTLNVIINSDMISELIHKNIKDLGESGDSYIVNAEGLLITNTRLGDYTENSALVESVITKGTKALSAPIKKKDYTFRFLDEYKDYLNNDVLGATAVVKFGDSAIGLVVEIDSAEAFAEVAFRSKVIIILVVIMTILNLGIALIISGMIAAPLIKTSNMLKDIAEGEGDLTKELQLQLKDEVGTVGKWFDQFVIKIRNLIIEVAKDAGSVNESSYQISQAIESANDGMGEVLVELDDILNGVASNASLVEELNASLEEMASGSTVVSEETTVVNVNAEEALKAAGVGKQKLNDVVESIEAVKESSIHMKSVINELNNSSQGISEIVNLIDGISEQTNLLALNAAIESARAGEHGKGFAVVADEVRKLAEQSRDSTKKITILIDEINKRVNEAFLTMQKENSLVDNSVIFAQNAQMTFEEILKAVEQVVTKISTISELSENQANISAEMANAMGDLSHTTLKSTEAAQSIHEHMDNQAAIFEEIGASIQELRAMSEGLKDQTGRFKTK